MILNFRLKRKNKTRLHRTACDTCTTSLALAANMEKPLYTFDELPKQEQQRELTKQIDNELKQLYVEIIVILILS